MPIDTAIDRRGAVAVAAGAAVWGLFWIPLRAIENAGLDGLTVVAIANASAALVLLAASLFGARQTDTLSRKTFLQPHALLLGLTLGASSVLYMLALLYTDVVRAVFLFYLLPVWAMLAARIFYAEPITPRQLLAVILTIIGVWLLLGGDAEHLSVQPGFGDTLAIAAGMTWGFGLALLGDRNSLPPVTSAIATFVSATALALLALLVVSQLAGSMALSIDLPTSPSPEHVFTIGPIKGVYYAIAFGVILLLPSVLGQIWGADRLPATLAAVLTTTEILVATVSAVTLIGTSVDTSGALGALFIGAAIWLALRSTRTGPQH